MSQPDYSEFMDLINGPPVAALTTVMPNGQPQTTVVWCDFDGMFVRVNTMRGFRKEKNMRANPKVTLKFIRKKSLEGWKQPDDIPKLLRNLPGDT